MSASKIISGVASVWHALTGFLEKHVSDLNAVASGFSEVVGALPLDPQDKQRLIDSIGTVERSAKNISNWLANAPENPGEVTLKESDIVNSLANYFNSEAGQAALANAVKSAEGNANAPA